MNSTQKIIYQLLGQTVLWLVFYGVAVVVASVNFLPTTTFNSPFSYVQAQGFAHVALQLALYSGLLGGGVYVLLTEQADAHLKQETLLMWLGRGWTFFMVLVVLVSAFGALSGRASLELPLVLHLFLGVLLVGFAIFFGINTKGWSAFHIVWMVGAIVVIVCHFLGTLSLANPAQDRILRVLTVNLKLNVGIVLMSVALVFWLMRRFSTVRQAWAEDGLYTVAGLLALNGALISGSALYAFGSGVDLGLLPVVIALIALAVYASHSYHTFINHNANYTLSGHWTALNVVLWMVSLGVLGAITALPDVARVAQGTRLTDLQATLTELGSVAILFGFINQASSELRGENRRITGLLPFWLVTFGIIGSSLALGVAGAVQVYLERLLSVGYLDTQNALAPLYLGWLVGLFAVMLGVIIYAVGFRARRAG